MLLIAALIAIALIFDFLNGLHDAANSIATIVSTRVLAPRYAVMCRQITRSSVRRIIHGISREPPAAVPEARRRPSHWECRPWGSVATQAEAFGFPQVTAECSVSSPRWA